MKPLRLSQFLNQTRQTHTKTPLSSLSPTTLNYYWDTTPPTTPQLTQASTFFTPSPTTPKLLWTASKFRTTPLDTSQPEIAFLGRSNVGKSSLLNALMARPICYTSSKPGRTRAMNAFGIGIPKGDSLGRQAKIVLLDMPGYGKASRAEWGVEIMKYLQGRKQLRRAFLLIDASHGLKKSDIHILELFRQYAIPHQIVLSKVDRVLSKSRKQLKSGGVSDAGLAQLRKRLHDLRPVVQPDVKTAGGMPTALGEILTCSAEMEIGPGRSLGVDALRWAVLAAAGYGGSVEVKKAVPSVPSNASVSDTQDSTVSPAG